LRGDLARVHKLLSNYCNAEFTSKKSGSQLQQEEEEQLKVVSLIGTSLLPEEFFFVGFLPL
jgi:hypothetical protein